MILVGLGDLVEQPCSFSVFYLAQGERELIKEWTTYNRPLHVVQTKLPTVTLEEKQSKIIDRTHRWLRTQDRWALWNYNQNIAYSLVVLPIHESFEHISLLDVCFSLKNCWTLFV